VPQLPPHELDPARIEEGIRIVLEGLGQAGKPEVMENTPRRVADLYVESINPAWVDAELPLKTFGNPTINERGERTLDSLIIVNDVHYTSYCEHHLAPAFGVAQFAYVPDQHVVGYSKVKKALNWVARGPQLNERILSTTMAVVADELKPLGAALALQSAHCCIALRSNGPAQEVVTVQAAVGCLEEEPFASAFRASYQGRKPLFLGA
jgi:GTP cyclohydrolase I